MTTALDGKTKVYNICRDYGLNEPLPLMVEAREFNKVCQQLSTVKAELAASQAEAIRKAASIVFKDQKGMMLSDYNAKQVLNDYADNLEGE